jgi:hypothetical protein
MPLKLNLGLSRKVGESNYGSRGASVNVEMEVDSSLVTEPDKLKERIRALFGLVRTSLAEELNGNGNGHHPGTNGDPKEAGQGSNGNGNGNGNGQRQESGQRTNSPRPATQSQVKAIFAICRSQKVDMKRLLQDRFRVGHPEDLNIKEASALIDELKSDERKGG